MSKTQRTIASFHEIFGAQKLSKQLRQPARHRKTVHDCYSMDSFACGFETRCFAPQTGRSHGRLISSHRMTQSFPMFCLSLTGCRFSSYNSSLRSASYFSFSQINGLYSTLAKYSPCAGAGEFSNSPRFCFSSSAIACGDFFPSPICTIDQTKLRTM